jgi:hypothetical protein
MSIHGWGTSGTWHSEFSLAVSELGLVPVEFNYGFTLRFDKFKVESLVKRFRKWYHGVAENPVYGLEVSEPYHRPSIACHSLGSWIVARALKKYSDIKFDKVFLYGSIIPSSFDWYSLILRDQVHLIINEVSKKDQFVRLGYFITLNPKSCCRNKFIQQSRLIKYEDASEFAHSDFQYKERFINQFEKYLFAVPYQLKIIHGKDINMKTLQKYFKSTGRIDYQTYGNDYNLNPITIERAIGWAEIEPDIWSFLVDSYTNEVIGYINALPVSSSIFKLFISGKLPETEIKAENIIPYEENGDFEVIIMSIAIEKKIIEKEGGIIPTRHGEILQMALAQKLVENSKAKKKLKTVASIAWTASGLKLSERFGLEPTEVTYSNHPVYLGNINKIKYTNSNKIGAIAKWFIRRVND